METQTQLTLENLDRTSKNWDKQTKQILLFIDGSGNMCGGSSRMLHITLHGDNSIIETGTITISGVVRVGYRIRTGGKGENSQSLSYYKGLDNFANIDLKTPTYKVNIEGSCGGAKEAMCAILSAQLDWKI